MGMKQISVFLENTTGRLCEVTKTLAKAGINLRAINIADTADFGILRIIVDKTEEAANVLNAAGFTIKMTTVAAVEIDDKPGSLDKLIEMIQQSGINIEYLYASLGGAANVLNAAGFTIKMTTVAAVEIDDKPGSLDKLIVLIQKSGINIEYLYASLGGNSGKAVVIFKLEDHDKGFALLEKSGLVLADKL